MIWFPNRCFVTLISPVHFPMDSSHNFDLIHHILIWVPIWFPLDARQLDASENYSIPDEIVASWKQAVQSRSRAAKNAVFQSFLKAGKDWSKFLGGFTGTGLSSICQKNMWKHGQSSGLPRSLLVMVTLILPLHQGCPSRPPGAALTEPLGESAMVQTLGSHERSTGGIFFGEPLEHS